MYIQIKKLLWDSHFFGFNLGCVSISDSKQTPSDIDLYIKSTDVGLLQANPNTANLDFVYYLESQDFHLYDTYSTWQLEVVHSYPLHKITVADVKYIRQLEDIASDSFTLTRFGYEAFPKDKVKDLYRSWVQKSVTGEFDDGVLICVSGNTVTGFITYRILHGLVRIGLIAVGKNYRRSGLAQELIYSVADLAHKKNIRKVEATTSLKNFPALNLYARLGFKFTSSSYWYYKSIP